MERPPECVAANGDCIEEALCNAVLPPSRDTWRSGLLAQRTARLY
jgi:hypothetical protein